MRSTLDVDIAAGMRLEYIQPLVAALSKDFYADDEMMKDAIEYKSSFNSKKVTDLLERALAESN